MDYPLRDGDGFALEQSRNGELSVRYRTKYLHSKYNPTREAASFIDRLSLEENRIEWILVIGEGIPYLSSLLARNFPKKHIIAFPLSPAHILRQAITESQYPENLSVWYDDTDADPSHFLSSSLPEHQCHLSRALQWTPALKAAPRETGTLIHAISSRIQELSSNNSTRKAFAHRWLSNTLRHLHRPVLDKHLRSISRIKGTLLICASGPELKNQIPLLHKNRSNFLLMALPSSLAALTAAGLDPDLILHADPGFWARHHLRSWNHPESNAILVSSLYGALPERDDFSAYSFFVESDSPFSSLPEAVIRLPAGGTVAANALELGFRLGADQIIFLGLDLKAEGFSSHVSPHPFDPLLLSRSNRCSTDLSMSLDRSLHLNIRPALDRYRSYFSRISKSSTFIRLCGSASASISDSCDADYRNLPLLLQGYHRPELSFSGKLQYSHFRRGIISSLQYLDQSIHSMQESSFRLLVQSHVSKLSLHQQRVLYYAEMLDPSLEASLYEMRSLSASVMNGVKAYA